MNINISLMIFNTFKKLYNVSKVLMLCREEYLLCDFPCLLSSIGGYVGLFFRMSIFDLILTSEWMMSYFKF